MKGGKEWDAMNSYLRPNLQCTKPKPLRNDFLGKYPVKTSIYLSQCFCLSASFLRVVIIPLTFSVLCRDRDLSYALQNWNAFVSY